MLKSVWLSYWSRPLAQLCVVTFKCPYFRSLRYQKIYTMIASCKWLIMSISNKYFRHDKIFIFDVNSGLSDGEALDWNPQVAGTVLCITCSFKTIFVSHQKPYQFTYPALITSFNICSCFFFKYTIKRKKKVLSRRWWISEICELLGTSSFCHSTAACFTDVRQVYYTDNECSYSEMM